MNCVPDAPSASARRTDAPPLCSYSPCSSGCPSADLAGWQRCPTGASSRRAQRCEKTTIQQVVVCSDEKTRLHVVEEVGMVGSLFQQHQDVQLVHLLGLARPVHHISVLHPDLDAELSPHLAEADKRSWFPLCSSPKNGCDLDGWMACHRGRDWGSLCPPWLWPLEAPLLSAWVVFGFPTSSAVRQRQM